MGNKIAARNFPRASNEKHYDNEHRYDPPRRANFSEGPYYGNDYGGEGDLHRGRDYERNIGYREGYNGLTTGQWPEIESAANRRNFDLHRYELEQRGIHHGKGPRNYTRSDARIREDINDMLYEDPYIDASDVEVSVENGDVILSGTIDDRMVKRRIDDILDTVRGVKHWENRLRVRRPANPIVNIRNAE
jgi:hypothetical protein